MSKWGTHRSATDPTTRRRVLQRDGHQCTIIEHGARCTQPATELHHLTEHDAGGTDDENNLVSVCTWHHHRLTAAYANRVRWPTRTRRDREHHPGWS